MLRISRVYGSGYLGKRLQLRIAGFSEEQDINKWGPEIFYVLKGTMLGLPVNSRIYIHGQEA